ncbi:hypothetical protein Ade02nite_35190 [Paractinoplanes deccanensis]|uniref:Uncharacterized protein n=1 Tax=Paractinoplanes deccanensis TaxID=113561 RepID=A0ABQ3Y4F4_9ACTN|nr:hypothetical protein [Actinoplanes deccanensis]GID74878.1 hypothetical protein Ade02nite_35190 [Actinoplanes deccanensis]
MDKSLTPSAERSTGPPHGLGPPAGVGWRVWREGALTRAKEIETLSAWLAADGVRDGDRVLLEAIGKHLAEARRAAESRSFSIWPGSRSGPLMERAASNLDAAEADLLALAPPSFVLSQMPGLLREVRTHLSPDDPRRQEFEVIARELGAGGPAPRDADLTLVETERGKIVSVVRAVRAAAMRERVRLRSFRSVVVVTGLLMALLAVGIALLGLLRPSALPLCFAPEQSGSVTVVCPTARSAPFIPEDFPPQRALPVRDVDAVTAETVRPLDLLVVELVGLAAAAVGAALALRGARGSSERYGLPIALAALKLPTGALTAFLGLLLLRGQFVPGLGALDAPAQILGWALVFGYGQQLFTRLVDREAQVAAAAAYDADVRQSRVAERRIVERRLSDQALEQVVGTVGETIKTALSGPTLVNFDGWIGIEITGEDGAPVPITDEQEVPLLPDHRYVAVVAIATEQPPGYASRLRITGGVEAHTAEFSVVLDSDDPASPKSSGLIAVPTRAGRAGVELPFETWPDGTPPWLWVRVAQRGRVVQNVELVGIAADADGRG